MRFKAASYTQDRVRRIKKKYLKIARRQSGKGLAGNLAKIGLEMGSQAINSSFGKKIIKGWITYQIYLDMESQK